MDHDHRPELEVLDVVDAWLPDERPGEPPACTRAVTHSLDVDLLAWFLPDRRPRPRPGDGSVRRVLVWDPETTRAAMDELVDDAARTAAGSIEIAGRGARLLLVPRPAGSTWTGALHLRRSVHPVPVALVVVAWSALRTELRLDRCEAVPHPGRRLDRWYEGAHSVLDVVRAELALRARPITAVGGRRR